VSEQYIVWALIVGVVVGAALYWFALGRLPRETDDISPRERIAEAGWISRTIEQRGGVAPVDLVEEVLDMHSAYLSGPALEVRDEHAAEPLAEATAEAVPAGVTASPATTPADSARAKPTTRPEDAPQGS
jgi:HAMP domain-containing protein